MTISQSSRYSGNALVTVTTATGSAVAVFGLANPAIPNFFHYRVVDGDRFDTIANALYGDPTYWWRIAQLNPEVFYPDQLTPGIIIRIPTA